MANQTNPKTPEKTNADRQPNFIAIQGTAAAATAPVEALDTGLAHQPGDPLVVHRQAQPEGELGVHSRPAVSGSSGNEVQARP